MNNCAFCKIADRPSVVEDTACSCSGGEVEGHAYDCRKLAHTLTLQILTQETAPTKKQLAAGWRERPHGFRGRPALFRYLCRACVNKQAMSKEITEFKTEKCNPVEAIPTMYQILCD